MKKLLALALAVVMMMAIALPAFAANGESATHSWGITDETPGADDVQNNFDNVVLEYGVAQAYTVTIPADINFGYMNAGDNVLTDTRDVSVTNAVISGKDQLVITVASENGWKMADTYGKSTDVSYDAQVGVRTPFNEKYDNNTETADAVVCTVMVVNAATGNNGTTVDNDQTVTIRFTTAGTAQEGLYRDTLTFTVTIKDMEVAGTGAFAVTGDYNATFAGERTVAPATGA